MTEKELLEICIEVIKHTNPQYHSYYGHAVNIGGYNNGPMQTNSDTNEVRAAAINIINKKLSNYIPEMPKHATI